MNVNAYIHEISNVLPKISSYNVKAANSNYKSSPTQQQEKQQPTMKIY